MLQRLAISGYLPSLKISFTDGAQLGVTVAIITVIYR